jgi:O-acetyl-ADP-ribose deacetylase (regulator of RNase III)
MSYPENRELKIKICDLLGAPVDAIVNPANSGLSHGGGIAALISREAGPKLDLHCEKIIEKYGKIPVTKAVITTAGRMQFKGIIHAVGPRMGDGDEQNKIETTIINCMRNASEREWSSVGFPAISTGLFCIEPETCARAFKNAIPSFWNKYPDSSVKLVWLCLTVDDFPKFKKIFQF